MQYLTSTSNSDNFLSASVLADLISLSKVKIILVILRQKKLQISPVTIKAILYDVNKQSIFFSIDH